MINLIIYITLAVCILGIMHTYVLYPFLMFAFSKKNKLHVSDNTTFKVGILIAAYNEEKVIAKKIESILSSNYPLENITIYIGSDASKDNTNAIIDSFAQKNKNIQLINFSGRTGKAAIINQLAEKCTSELFILTDANVMFDQNTIRNLVKHFANNEVHLVCSNILKTSDKNLSIQPIEKSYLNIENKVKSCESNNWQLVIGAEGGCYAIRKANYSPVPKNYFMDDFYITMSVLNNGGKVLFETEAICYEDLPSQSSEEFKRKVRISIGNFQNLSAFKHLLWPIWKPLGFAFFSHKVLRWHTPFLLLIIYACTLILAVNSKFFLVLSIVQLLLFILPQFINQLNSIKPLLFIAHFYNMNFALLKGFFTYLKGVNSSVWEPTQRNA